ncbi:MAG: diacylglycerol kinase family protein [Bacteroidota bacterium]
MRLLVLLNPAARDGRTGRARPLVEAALAEAGAEAEVVETRRAGDAETLARTAEGVDAVVVAGGDGTIHEAVNGIVGTGLPLGVLPLGTGNDFAHALGMPDPLPEAVRAMLAAPVRDLDVGRVRWTDAAGEHERLFANCLGTGFDADAARIAGETKWLGGRAAYLAAVLRTLWAWRRPDVRVRVVAQHAGDAVPAASEIALPEAEPLFAGPLFLCEVGNGHSVGGGFLLTPDAVPDDGRLDVCLVRHLSPRRALGLLPK